MSSSPGGLHSELLPVLASPPRPTQSGEVRWQQDTITQEQYAQLCTIYDGVCSENSIVRKLHLMASIGPLQQTPMV